MDARDVSPYDLGGIARADRERKKVPSHSHSVAEFRVATYDKLLARAEAAEGRLEAAALLLDKRCGQMVDSGGQNPDGSWIEVWKPCEIMAKLAAVLREA